MGDRDQHVSLRLTNEEKFESSSFSHKKRLPSFPFLALSVCLLLGILAFTVYVYRKSEDTTKYHEELIKQTGLRLMERQAAANKNWQDVIGEHETEIQRLKYQVANTDTRFEILQQHLTSMESRMIQQSQQLKTLQELNERITSELKTHTSEAEITEKATPLRSCEEIHSVQPALPSGMYWIDPDGLGSGEPSIHVYCNMTTGSTVITHGSEYKNVSGECADDGCYSDAVNYNTSMRQMVALTHLSTSCLQQLQVTCFKTPLDADEIEQIWWDDRNGKPQYYWTGNKSNLVACQCGLADNCSNPFIIDKESLPVTKLHLPLTLKAVAQKLYNLGPLECSGRFTLEGPPESCADLWRTGHILNGVHSINSPDGIKNVHCDFSKLPGQEELQTVLESHVVETVPPFQPYARNETSMETSVTESDDIFQSMWKTIKKGLNLSSGGQSVAINHHIPVIVAFICVWSSF